MTALSDYKRLVEAPAIQSYEATIAAQRAEITRLTTRLAEAEKVIGFYADRRRHDGPNQKPIPGDVFAKLGAVYIQDVSRDGGQLARDFLKGDGND